MRDKKPYVKPVTKIELDTSNEKRRWILAGILLLVGIAAIGFGFFQAMSVQPGWEEVTVRSQETHCGEDFKFLYDFSSAGGSATAVNTALTKCYSDAAVQAYKLFSADVEEAGLHNMAYLNAHVNETVTVDAALYKALSQVAQSGNRQLFLAPAWVEYDRLFLCENDAEAAQYDPSRNEEVKDWLAELSVFADDPNHISLKCLDGNQVELAASQEYLAFAEEYGIESFADFGWMRNAFVADLIADTLIAQGFTQGYLVSFDGFTRNLYGSDTQFTQNIFSRQGSDIYMPARLHYYGPASIVILRDHPMSGRDRWQYYSYADGTVVTAFLDSRDCMSKPAISDLTVYSQDKSCTELVLQLSEIFIADSFQPERLQGVSAIWPEERSLCYNDETLNLELLPDSGPGYTKELK